MQDIIFKCIAVAMIVILEFLNRCVTKQAEEMDAYYLTERHDLIVEIIKLTKELEQKKEQESKGVPPYSLTEEERNLVERVVSAEIRGGSLKEQVGVATVILDRATLWGLSVFDVLFAEKQFAEPYQGEVSELTKLAVSMVFDSGARAFEEPVTHFYAHDIVTPYWADSMVTRGKDRFHTFMYKGE